MAYFENGKYDEAINYHEKCLQIQLKTLGKNHPKIADSYNNIGNVYLEKEELDEAINNFEKCLQIRLNTLENDHPKIEDCFTSIGIAYRKKGENEISIKIVEINLLRLM